MRSAYEATIHVVVVFFSVNESSPSSLDSHRPSTQEVGETPIQFGIDIRYYRATPTWMRARAFSDCAAFTVLRPQNGGFFFEKFYVLFVIKLGRFEQTKARRKNIHGFPNGSIKMKMKGNFVCNCRKTNIGYNGN